MRRATVKSASRTLEVLELFEEQRRPLRLKEIYQLLGYPQSSATNLLKSMVMMGYLNYSRKTWTYLPTARAAALGNWLLSFMYGQRDYESLLARIQRETDETVVLAAQNDLFIQYVRILTPAHEFKLPPPDGGMRVMTRSTAGHALMSRMPDRKVEKFIRQIHYYELSNSETLDLKTLMREVAWVRHTGYSYMPNNPPGAASIAFPLGDETHGIQLAIGVGGLNDRIARNQATIVETMRNAIADFHIAHGDDLTGAEPEG